MAAAGFASSVRLSRSILTLLIPRPYHLGSISSSRGTLSAKAAAFWVAPQGHALTVRVKACSFGSVSDKGKDEDAQSPPGKPSSVPVRVAYELLQGGHRYLDVRTHEEFSAGHPSAAINIPYMFKTGAKMSKNPQFLEEVSSQFQKDDEIVVGCQSGKRSLMAATDLQTAGFTNITDVAGGYSAWAENGLPVAK